MMKKIGRLTFLLTFVIGLISCKKDKLLLPSNSSTNDIIKEKQWYESNLSEDDKQVANLGLLKENLNWGKMENIENKNFTIIPYNGTSSKKVTVFLVLSKNEKDDILNARNVFISSKNYLNEIETKSILLDKNIQPNFNGSIIEYYINNKIVNAKYYENGLENHNQNPSIEIKPNVNSENRPIDDECESQTQICTDWYLVTTDHQSGQVVSEVYLYTTCSCGGYNPTSGGVDEAQPGVTRTRNQSYEVFRKQNSPGSPESWYMNGTCITIGLVFANTQNNTFTTINNPQSAAITIVTPALGGPFLPPAYPLSTWYCIMNSPVYTTYTGGVNNRNATMITRTVLTYTQQGGRTELINGGHTWDARFDL